MLGHRKDEMIDEHRLHDAEREELTRFFPAQSPVEAQGHVGCESVPARREGQTALLDAVVKASQRTMGIEREGDGISLDEANWAVKAKRERRRVPGDRLQELAESLYGRVRRDGAHPRGPDECEVRRSERRELWVETQL